MIPTELLAISSAVAEGKSPQATVRQILKWFGAQRRGFWILRDVNNALKEAKLTTEPSIEGTFIDGIVGFRALKDDSKEHEPVEGASSITRPQTPDVEAAIETAAASDPTYRVGRLDAANQPLISVTPDADIQAAITLMLNYAFSQIPVMQNPRTVKGMLRTTTIAHRAVLGQPIATVRECMERHVELAADDSLFAAIDLIRRHDYALIRGADNTYTGIVTASDLSDVLRTLAEPFLLLGEIENYLRHLINGHLSLDELTAMRNPEDTRTIAGVFDLTFGEYVRIIQNPEFWARFLLSLDRAVFVKLLEEARDIRNDVMHFDPDGIEPNQLNSLRRLAQMLRALKGFRVIGS